MSVIDNIWHEMKDWRSIPWGEAELNRASISPNATSCTIAWIDDRSLFVLYNTWESKR